MTSESPRGRGARKQLTITTNHQHQLTASTAHTGSPNPSQRRNGGAA
jgi:hypothetical protein